MELREFIEIGAKKAGSLTELGKMLGQDQRNMTSAKGHRRPLPLDAAVKLADYVGADLRAVIAANELVTEKKEEKRAFWTPFAQSARAAGIAIAFSLVTNFVTPTPANALPVSNADSGNLYYVKLRMLIALLKQFKLNRVRNFIERGIERFLAPLQPIFPPRVTQV